MNVPRGEIAEQIAHLRAAFDHFDEDEDGLLDAAELGRALRSLGHDVGPDEVRKIIASVDVNGDRVLDFPEFVDLVEPRDLGDDPDADLRDAFCVLDRDGDGFLDHAELSAAGDGVLGDGGAAAVITSVDLDGDGRISFAEFSAWMGRS